MVEHERRSGKERRDGWPEPCQDQVCEPVDKKLEKIRACIEHKTPQRLFYWVAGGLAAFCVLVIGGAQWLIKDQVSSLQESVQSQITALHYLEKRIDLYALSTDRKIERLEDSINQQTRGNKGSYE